MLTLSQYMYNSRSNKQETKLATSFFTVRCDRKEVRAINAQKGETTRAIAVAGMR